MAMTVELPALEQAAPRKRMWLRTLARLRRFARRARDVRLELRTASSSEVTNLVRRGEATLGLRYFPDADPMLAIADRKDA